MIKNSMISFKVSEEEKQLIADAAYRARMPVSQLIREVMQDYLEREAKFSDIEITVRKSN